MIHDSKSLCTAVIIYSATLVNTQTHRQKSGRATKCPKVCTSRIGLYDCVYSPKYSSFASYITWTDDDAREAFRVIRRFTAFHSRHFFPGGIFVRWHFILDSSAMMRSNDLGGSVHVYSSIQLKLSNSVYHFKEQRLQCVRVHRQFFQRD